MGGMKLDDYPEKNIASMHAYLKGLPGAGIAYDITCSTAKGHFADNEATFDQIVGTFKVN